MILFLMNPEIDKGLSIFLNNGYRCMANVAIISNGILTSEKWQAQWQPRRVATLATHR